MNNLSPGDLLRHLPLMIQDAANNTLPDAKASADEFVDVPVVVVIRHRRHEFKGGRAKGRVVWVAEGAVIAAAAGDPPQFTDMAANSTGALLK